MADTMNTIQFDDGTRIKGVPTSAIADRVRTRFADYMETDDSVVSWEDESNSLVRYWGVRCSGEIQDYPLARVTDTLEEV